MANVISLPQQAATVISLPQQAATALTIAAIDIGAKDASSKLARAQAAKAVAGVLQTASTGDMNAAMQQFQALGGAITDPGVAMLVKNLFAIGTPFLTVEAQIVSATPILGTSVQGWLADTAAGMVAAANAYINAPAAKTA